MLSRRYCVLCGLAGAVLAPVARAVAKLPPGVVPGPFAEWFRAQVQGGPTGMSCCDVSDGHHLAQHDWSWYNGTDDYWMPGIEVAQRGQPAGVTNPKDPRYIWAIYKRYERNWGITTANMAVWDQRTGKPTVNPTADTVIWTYDAPPHNGYPGYVKIYCFVPGPNS